MHISPIIVLTKIDRSGCALPKCWMKLRSLLIFGATEDQPIFQRTQRKAWCVAHRKLDDGSEKSSTTLYHCFGDSGTQGDPNGVLQAQVVNLDYSDFLGRIAIGRVFNGTLKRGADEGIAAAQWRYCSHAYHQVLYPSCLERDEAEEVPVAIWPLPLPAMRGRNPNRRKPDQRGKSHAA